MFIRRKKKINAFVNRYKNVKLTSSINLLRRNIKVANLGLEKSLQISSRTTDSTLYEDNKLVYYIEEALKKYEKSN